MRPIDADALKEKWYKINDIDENDRGARFVGYTEIARLIDNAPTIEPSKSTDQNVADVPSGDLIGRKEATSIPFLPKEHRRYQTMNIDDAYEQGWCDLEACIQLLPSADPNTEEWIPCSERLPESGPGLHYLVTLKDVHCLKDDVYEAFFDKNGWYIDCLELAYDDVIAWKPLPKPYKEGGEV